KACTRFNYPVVMDHFQKLDNILKHHGIPWENIYNMDEKEIQLGGGWKSNGRIFFFSQGDQQQFKIRGGSLELITVIECISANGKNIAPRLIFQGSYIDPECAEVDPDIWCVINCIVVKE
ncbi:hypothetical protein WOLCODRAFT_67882, partial [Wolfiporia cocos MD-104 SS10]